MQEYIFLLLFIPLCATICYFLSMIAKYYRLKSGQGLHPGYYYFSSILLIMGQVCTWSMLPSFFTAYLGPALQCMGGFFLLLCALALYRSMMSVNKTMG